MLVFDNVNYEYPDCGGYKVYKGSKWWKAILYSNYCGNYTGRTWILPLKYASYATEVIYIIENDRQHQDLKLIKKGQLVQ